MIALVSVALGWQTGSAWQWQPERIEEPFDLNLDSFGTLAPAADVEAAFTDALRVWSIEAEADVFLRYGGPTTLTQQGDGDDGRNTVLYGGSTFYSSLAVATSTTYIGDMIDCDIRFYRTNLYGTIDWHVGIAAAPADQLDLRHTMIHETGHCVGLRHSDVFDSIMSPTNGSGTGDERRHLTADDIGGVQQIYGAVEPELVLVSSALDGSGPGEAILAIELRNEGSGTAWLLEVTVEAAEGGQGFLAVVPAAQFVDAIGSPTPVGAVVAPDEVTLPIPVTLGEPCVGGVPQPATLEIVVEDASGRIRRFPVELDAVCPPTPPTPPVPTEPPPTVDPGPRNTGDVEEATGGCGCTSTGGSTWSLLAMLARR